MEPEKRVSVTTGFWVLLAILFYLDEGLDLLGWGLLACGCHELGHLIAVRALGGRISRLRLTVVGAELSLDPELPLSYGRECLAALAGPLANLFLAELAMRGRLFLLAGLSLGQGLFNLLPILPLDGGRCLYFLLTGLLDRALADRALRLTSAIAAGLLLGAGLVLSRQFGNLTLLITSLWLSAGLFRSWRWESAAQ